MGYNPTYGYQKPDIEKGQESLFTTDSCGNLAIKREHRVNKKEKLFVRTCTEV